MARAIQDHIKRPLAEELLFGRLSEGGHVRVTSDGEGLSFVLDDVAIPEISYFSDFEEDEDGWEPAGFIRHANVLPQRWLVQMVLFGPETTVQRLGLDEDQTGSWIIPLDGRTDRATLTISGLAPVTTEMGSYSYEIEEQ